MTRRWLLVPVLAVLVSACAGNALRQARQADEARDFDLAVARYAAIVRDDPDNVAAQQGLARAKLRASEEHYARGRRFMAQGRSEDAVVEYQLAVELNPTDAEAETGLRDARQAVRDQLTVPDTGRTPLETLLARSVDLEPSGFALPDARLPAQVSTGTQTTVHGVYLTIAALADLTITFDSEVVDLPAPVTILSDLSVRQALDTVAAATNTFYVVTGPSMVIVAPNTPAKQRQYVSDVVRQFPLQNVDLAETLDALRVVGDYRFVFGVPGTNTILARDTPDRIRSLGRFLATFDKPKPEIVVDVEVMEVDRTRFQEYGLELASPGSAGIDGAASIAGSEDGISLETLRNLSQADVLMTNIPVLYYRLLKTDSNTRILANPHVRMTDGTEAVAEFGQRIPVPTLTITPITQGGVAIQPQTQFNYETIGVNIGMVSRTHANDDVTLQLNIELSSLGAPGFNGLPTFGARRVTTEIRLRDGETNILAGLIREDERTERQHIPGLGDVPVLGHLFGRNRREAQQTDVVIMLTPHILRGLDVSEEDLRPLPMPMDAASSVGVEPMPIIPPQPLRDNVPPAAGQPQTQPQFPDQDD